MEISGKTILVTGGAGFLGRYIVAALREGGARVRAYQRSAADDLAEAGVEVVRGTVTDASALRRAAQGCAAVIHTAAKAGVWGSRREFVEANIEGTRNVLAACREGGVPYLVHTSTPSVVFSGESFEGADESLPYGKNWLCHYAETKATAEQEALAADGGTGLRVCALRPHLIWGLGDPHLLPRVIARARAGRLAVVGDGSNRVDITHVRNAAAAHILALDALAAGSAGGKAYFLSQGEPVELWPWIHDLLACMNIPPVKRRVSFTTAYRVGAVAEMVWRVLRLGGEPPMTRFVATELAKSHWFDISAARRDLGYCPERNSTEAGLREYTASVA
ncbi:MAG: NAD-dependent epimerase/dehydratase family protein [Opitutales bacterium]|nr:NAD-dependent epimerase/dehydratase family protein [Opitutales bacterium]